jgi:hypothetical protein
MRDFTEANMEGFVLVMEKCFHRSSRVNVRAGVFSLVDIFDVELNFAHFTTRLYL